MPRAVPIQTYQPAFGVHILGAAQEAHLRALVADAFPERERPYALGVCELDSLACAFFLPPGIYFHPLLDHPDTPLFVLEAIVLHEACHLAMGPDEGHSPQFWDRLSEAMAPGLQMRFAGWVDIQQGAALEKGWQVRRRWRRAYLRSRDCLFDWRDRQHKDWSLRSLQGSGSGKA